MKFKEGYKVRSMAGENVVIMQGTAGSDMTRIISLNDSSLLLWNELQDKEFIKQYGKETVFSYGCSPTGGPDIDAREDENGYLPRLPVSDIYVYRMTITNEDGEVVEYTPDFMRYRCEQMGVKTVPVFGKAIISADRLHFVQPDGWDHDYLLKEGMTIGDLVMKVVEEFYDGPDPVGKTHVREGVVVRIINRAKFTAYKHKNFEFKCLSGIAMAEAESKGNIIDESIAAEM